MERDKQIEKIDVMANDIAMTCPDLVDSGCGRRTCVECLANGMTDLGYRLASDVALEVISEIEQNFEIGYGEVLEFRKFLAELKKKYESEKGNG